ncbi:MAG: hypothetical protein CMN57_06265 [Gammaproteobacteria bacterium]|nr:hypothetical protein [Gammaproteobacteria bacterium]
MSLVNQVLRDLDARREAQPLDAALDGLRSAPPATRSAHKAGIALGAVALLGLTGVLAWLYLQPPATPAPAAITESRPTRQDPTQPIADPASAAPATNPVLVSDTGFQAVADADTRARSGASSASAPDPEPAAAQITPEAAPASAEPASDPDTASEPELSPPDRNAAGSTTPAMRKTPRPLSPAEQAGQHFADGLDALGQGQWRLAEQALQAALAADPDHLHARESLSGVLLYQGRRREAEQVLAAGLERHPQAPSLARPYARLILEQGRDTVAIEVLETALVNAADNADYLALLAGVYQRNQRYVDAAASYRAALSLAPQRAAWWLGLGLALEGSGELQPAAGAYRSAIENPGLNPETRRYAEQRLQQLNHLLGRQ